MISLAVLDSTSKLAWGLVNQASAMCMSDGFPAKR